RTGTRSFRSARSILLRDTAYGNSLRVRLFTGRPGQFDSNLGTEGAGPAGAVSRGSSAPGLAGLGRGDPAEGAAETPTRPAGAAWISNPSAVRTRSSGAGGM